MNIETLYIKGTEETPEVRLTLDDAVSYMVGRSMPENAFEFYEPIIAWVRAYALNVDSPLRLELSFDYFNSSSSRYLFEILHILEKSKYKQQYRIIWKTDPDDDLMIEKGEELQGLSDLHFELAFIK